MASHDIDKFPSPESIMETLDGAEGGTPSSGAPVTVCEEILSLSKLSMAVTAKLYSSPLSRPVTVYVVFDSRDELILTFASLLS